MELKPDLIRNLLLYSESTPTDGVMNVQEIMGSKYFEDYGYDEVVHAINTMGDSGAKLINAKITYASNKPYFFYIGSPTFEGHSYLENIKDPKIWKVTKEAAKGLTGVSIGVLGELAKSKIKEMLGIL